MLIAEAGPGRWDKYGWATTTQMVAGAEALFGAKHQDLVMVKEPGERQRWMPEERHWGEFDPPTMLNGTGSRADMKLRANFYLQTLSPTDGEVILQAGDKAAGVMKRVGAGDERPAGQLLWFQRAGV